MSMKKILIPLSAVLLQFALLLGIISFQNSIFMTFPLFSRAFLQIVVQWLMLIVPVGFMKLLHIKLSDIGFAKQKITTQIVIGAILGLAISLFITVLPILAGLKNMLGTTSFTQTWQFVYQFVYMIFGVALVEEFFFRGFLFERVKSISESKWVSIIISSCVFGLSHIFIGNIIQVFTTSLLGILFCICRDKIKNCTTLSLIIMHGIHNALITLFVAILP